MPPTPPPSPAWHLHLHRRVPPTGLIRLARTTSADCHAPPLSTASNVSAPRTPEFRKIPASCRCSTRFTGVQSHIHSSGAKPLAKRFRTGRSATTRRSSASCGCLRSTSSRFSRRDAIDKEHAIQMVDSHARKRPSQQFLAVHLEPLAGPHPARFTLTFAARLHLLANFRQATGSLLPPFCFPSRSKITCGLINASLLRRILA